MKMDILFYYAINVGNFTRSPLAIFIHSRVDLYLKKGNQKRPCTVFIQAKNKLTTCLFLMYEHMNKSCTLFLTKRLERIQAVTTRCVIVHNVENPFVQTECDTQSWLTNDGTWRARPNAAKLHSQTHSLKSDPRISPKNHCHLRARNGFI
jgi:hypothetical protein